MFSEYASRFLAKSTLRDGGRQSIYQPTGAPLFFSAADYPADDREHDQEISAIYALQKSRRNLYYSPDQDDEEYRQGSDRGSTNDGIRSSWNPGLSISSDATETAGGNKMVDVSLEEELVMGRLNDDVTPNNNDGRADSPLEASRHTEDPIKLPFQRFRTQTLNQNRPFADLADRSRSVSYLTHHDTEDGSHNGVPDPESKSRTVPGSSQTHPDTIPQPVSSPLSPPTHDRIWAKLYGAVLACMFATAFMVWLHLDEPKNSPIGDSIYSVLQKALPLLATDTLVTIFVAFVWMLCLKYFIKPLLYILVVSVPAVMVCLSIYPLVTSLQGPWKGRSFQDLIMRLSSLLPLCLAFLWVFILYRGRLALHKATSMLQLALTIFVENPALLLCGLFVLIITILFTWIWIFLVIRVFLNGRSAIVGGKPVWQLDGMGWSLGAFFVCVYLWTLGVLANLQRVTISATVSHWYFYRKSTGTFSPAATFSAATHHALTTMFGSVCFSSFVALMTRLPLLVLPGRTGSLIHIVCFKMAASPVIALTDPLAVTYGAIHSLPLVRASRQINQIGLVTMTQDISRDNHSKSAYRLTKMLLTAARLMTSLALGIGAWVRTAHITNGGSLYGYVVGLLAGSIGWAILGTAERSLADIVDACLVCAISDHSTDEYQGQESLSPSYLHESNEQEHPQENVNFSIEIQKSNCLLLGPSGTGKTLIAKTLAKILDVPFSISDCTSFTQAGYVGEDVDVCVQRLLASCNWDTRRAETGIICLDEVDKISSTKTSSHGRDVSGEGVQQALLKILEGTTLQITNPKSRPSSQQISGIPSANSQSGGVTSSFQNFGSFGPAYSGNSSSTKGEIHTIDTSNILFILCGAFNGLNKIILDRISKHSIGFNAPVRTRSSNPNAISFEGVGKAQNFYNARLHSGWREHNHDDDQRNLVIGSKQGIVNVLDFTEPKDLISFGFLPEFVGRLPILAALNTFDEETLVRVLSEPRNSLLRQYEQLFGMSGVELKFTSMALRHIAKLAIAMDTGARALRTVLERLLADAMFEAPGSSIKYILVNSAAAKFEQPPLYFSRGQRDRFQGAFAAEDTTEWSHPVQQDRTKVLSNEGEMYQPVAAKAV
ncbi:hypothetical protein AA313_de0209668 [Arthrobotrys entomopaga]|nr:hypothetical protein AA313_de0209668 [Arthrobotrys entomopaga]